MSITQNELSQLFDYSEDTGTLTWKVKPSSKVSVGSEAGYICTYKYGKQYRRVKINKKNYYVHRLIWILINGEDPGTIDHINGNGLDNRLVNLRSTSLEDNSKNLRMRSSNTSGVTGVYWHRDASKWIASIRVKGKNKYLGLFTEFEDAIIARKEAEKEHGFYNTHGL